MFLSTVAASVIPDMPGLPFFRNEILRYVTTFAIGSLPFGALLTLSSSSLPLSSAKLGVRVSWLRAVGLSCHEMHVGAMHAIKARDWGRAEECRILVL